MAKQANTENKNTSNTTKAATNATTAKKRTTTQTKATVEKKVAPDPVEAKKKEPKKFASDEMIPCKSVRYGTLYYNSKSGISYEWADFGDITYVQYSDLLAMKTSKSKVMFAPWFIIQDEELVDQWKRDLKDIYIPFEDIDEVENLLNGDINVLQERAENASEGYKDILVAAAGRMIRENRLDSLKVIQILDETFGTNLKALLK